MSYLSPSSNNNNVITASGFTFKRPPDLSTSRAPSEQLHQNYLYFSPAASTSHNNNNNNQSLLLASPFGNNGSGMKPASRVFSVDAAVETENTFGVMASSHHNNNNNRNNNELLLLLQQQQMQNSNNSLNNNNSSSLKHPLLIRNHVEFTPVALNAVLRHSALEQLDRRVQRLEQAEKAIECVSPQQFRDRSQSPPINIGSGLSGNRSRYSPMGGSFMRGNQNSKTKIRITNENGQDDDDDDYFGGGNNNNEDEESKQRRRRQLIDDMAKASSGSSGSAMMMRQMEERRKRDMLMMKSGASSVDDMLKRQNEYEVPEAANNFQSLRDEYLNVRQKYRERSSEQVHSHNNNNGNSQARDHFHHHHHQNAMPSNASPIIRGGGGSNSVNASPNIISNSQGVSSPNASFNNNNAQLVNPSVSLFKNNNNNVNNSSHHNRFLMNRQ